VRRVPPGDVAVVFGSGLSVVPDGAAVEEEVSYEELGWPATEVAGHPNRLLAIGWTLASGRRLRALLAFGRPHLYEGWERAELERPVRDLAAAGVPALVATNAAGSLGPGIAAGTALVVTELIDLQRAPRDRAPVLRVAADTEAARLAAALAPALPAGTGRYVAVPGPQYETPAEAAWLRSLGEVVGMSTAPEVACALALGLPVCAVSLVVNVSGASLDHAEVVAAAGRVAGGLARGLGPLVDAFLSGRTSPAASRSGDRESGEGESSDEESP